MGRKVTKVAFGAPELPRDKNVAAYCRVSSGKDAMLHSLEAQVSYYSSLIQNHSGWEYAGVYILPAVFACFVSICSIYILLSFCKPCPGCSHR